MEISNKRALVLGGTSGIGFATAGKLAAAGAEVITCGVSEAGIDAARSSTGDAIARWRTWFLFLCIYKWQ